ncbi:unnamed protein product, partial [Choristocarpus tenellus]
IGSVCSQGNASGNGARTGSGGGGTVSGSRPQFETPQAETKYKWGSQPQYGDWGISPPSSAGILRRCARMLDSTINARGGKEQQSKNSLSTSQSTLEGEGRQEDECEVLPREFPPTKCIMGSAISSIAHTTPVRPSGGSKGVVATG